MWITLESLKAPHDELESRICRVETNSLWKIILWGFENHLNSGNKYLLFVSFNKAKQFVIIFKKFVKDMPEYDWIDFKRALKHDNTYNNSLSSRVVCVLIYYDLAQRFTEYDYNHLQRFLNALKKLEVTHISLSFAAAKNLLNMQIFLMSFMYKWNKIWSTN